MQLSRLAPLCYFVAWCSLFVISPAVVRLASLSTMWRLVLEQGLFVTAFDPSRTISNCSLSRLVLLSCHFRQSPFPLETTRSFAALVNELAREPVYGLLSTITTPWSYI